ncbi:hypothetical protein PR048_030798 [Dryococelus australis]|uniref:Uncharacterized protein n=1 Tax=Dryococelus australis TaxID=614101 RepID=A0ABQ9GA06_9NEOP|nr:hypothetical protein PR048_030798 [Dryococelus australis]
MRVKRGMELRWNARAGGNGRSPRKPAYQQHRPEAIPLEIEPGDETGDPRENPLTSGTVRHDSRMRKFGGDPAGDRARFP